MVLDSSLCIYPGYASIQDHSVCCRLAGHLHFPRQTQEAWALLPVAALEALVEFRLGRESLVQPVGYML